MKPNFPFLHSSIGVQHSIFKEYQVASIKCQEREKNSILGTLYLVLSTITINP